jgi:hypothetical protein
MRARVLNTTEKGHDAFVFLATHMVERANEMNGHCGGIQVWHQKFADGRGQILFNEKASDRLSLVLDTFEADKLKEVDVLLAEPWEIVIEVIDPSR